MGSTFRRAIVLALVSMAIAACAALVASAVPAPSEPEMLSLPNSMASHGAGTSDAAGDRAPWHVVRTRHFIVTGAVDESFLTRLGRQLEQFRSALGLVLPETAIESRQPVWVVAFDTYDDYKRFAPTGAGGYFTAAIDRSYIVLPRLAVNMDPVQVALHEYSHATLAKNGRMLPAWLREGLPEFYSTFQLDPAGYSFLLGMPPKGRVEFLRDVGLMDLNDLVDGDTWAGAWKSVGRDRTTLGRLYGTSWVLVHFLMLADNEAWKPQLQRYLELVRGGQTGRQALDATLGPKIAELQRRLKQYVNAGSIPAIIYTTNSSSAEGGSPNPAAVLPEVDVCVIRAELLERVSGKGENHAQQALALEPGQASALAVMGRASFSQGQPSQALDYFHAALRSDPTHLGAKAGLATTLAFQRDFAGAVAAYEALLAGPVDWGRGNLLNRLGLALLRAGDPARAATSFAEASSSGEDDQEMLRSRAYAYLGVGNGAAASAAARTCLQNELLADQHRPYLAIVGILGERMATRSAPDPALQRSCASAGGKWPATVCDYLLSRTDETGVFRAAGSNTDRLTEAHAYVALNLLVAGNQEAALPHLRWVLQSGNRMFFEYPLAQDTLARLGNPAPASGVAERLPGIRLQLDPAGPRSQTLPVAVGR